jgi:hypothetical protein
LQPARPLPGFQDRGNILWIADGDLPDHSKAWLWRPQDSFHFDSPGLFLLTVKRARKYIPEKFLLSINWKPDLEISSITVLLSART